VVFQLSQKSGFLGFGKNKWAGDKTDLPRCRVRDSFLSPDEIAFYKVLQPAVAGIFTVCPKVNLNRIFDPEKKSEKRSAAGPIAEIAVDFLLCDSTTMQPVLGVELDPEPRELENLQEKSYLIDEIFITAGLPLARIYISSEYDPHSLRECMLEAAAISGVPGREPFSVKNSAALQDKEVKAQPEDSVKAGNETEKEHSIEDKTVVTVLPAEPEGPKGALDAPLNDTISTEPAETRPGEADYAGANLEAAHTGQRANEFETSDYAERDEAQRSFAEDPPVNGNITVENEDSSTALFPVANGEELPESPEQDLSAQPGKPAAAGLEELKKRVIEEAAAAMENSPPPLCPQCKVPMELRTSKRGIRFYCCPNFTICREVRGIYE
jgi:hypothetical protein